MVTDLTFGSDPEIFVSKDGEVVPAFNFLPSAKAAGKNIFDTYNSAKYPYWDGFQAEFQSGVFTCRDELTTAVWSGMKTILESAPEGSKINIDSVVEIPREILQTVKQEHANLGCDPSLNVYGPEPINIRDARRLKYRFAGHHFHFGFDEYDDNKTALQLHNDPKLVVNIIQNLDATLGLAGVSLFENIDNPIRRKYYGRAGEFRLPKHGIEYRTLSSSVLVHPAIHHLLWDIGGRVVRLCVERQWENGGYVLPEKFPNEILDMSMVKNSINHYDANASREMLVECRKFLDYIFEMSYGYSSNLQRFAWKTILQPVEKTVSLDANKNWNFEVPYHSMEQDRFSHLGKALKPDDDSFYDDRYHAYLEEEDYEEDYEDDD